MLVLCFIFFLFFTESVISSYRFLHDLNFGLCHTFGRNADRNCAYSSTLCGLHCPLLGVQSLVVGVAVPPFRPYLSAPVGVNTLDGVAFGTPRRHVGWSVSPHKAFRGREASP
jgi:hypothetical protein